jgi:hypothetical protein
MSACRNNVSKFRIMESFPQRLLASSDSPPPQYSAPSRERLRFHHHRPSGRLETRKAHKVHHSDALRRATDAVRMRTLDVCRHGAPTGRGADADSTDADADVPRMRTRTLHGCGRGADADSLQTLPLRLWLVMAVGECDSICYKVRRLLRRRRKGPFENFRKFSAQKRCAKVGGASELLRLVRPERLQDAVD